jgi:mono/diheme cytochrome c family protein
VTGVEVLTLAIALSLSLPAMLSAAEPATIPGVPEELLLGLQPDAAKGYEAITTMPMGQPLLQVADIDRLWNVWEEEERAMAEKGDQAERRRLTFERYGWTKRPGDGVPHLPLGFTEDGKGGLVTNCFTCHGGKVAGVTIPGAGNTHVDLGTLREDLIRLRALDAGKDPFSVDFNSGIKIPASYHKGFTNAVIFEVLEWVQANPGVMLRVMANPGMLLHHDMNPPAWWTTKKKARLYTDAFAPKTPRQNMPFARGRGQKNWEEKWHALEPTFVHILQYIEKLEAPKYPFEIDTALAERGQVLFEQTCSECHGTYGPNGEFPNRVVPIEEVGTDSRRLHAVSKENRVWDNSTWLQYNGKHPVWLESKGYLAPPLDGVWASAPYFHNGSAPTLWAVMNPRERPKVWKRTEDGYDSQKVGLEVQVFDAVPEGLTERVRRMYYNTSHVGNSAAGHEFPDVLDAEEKRAVIEYLKTL